MLGDDEGDEVREGVRESVEVSEGLEGGQRITSLRVGVGVDERVVRLERLSQQCSQAGFVTH